MPSGRTHAVITSAAAFSLTVAAPAYVPAHGLSSLAIIPGCALGVLLTPDLDVPGPTYSVYQIRRLAGKAEHFAVFLWRLLWLPYARLIPHRSYWSHFPVFSTLLRLAYLLLPLFGLLLGLWFSSFVTGPVFPMSQVTGWLLHSTWLSWAFAGLVISDSLHWLFDLIF